MTLRAKQTVEGGPAISWNRAEQYQHQPDSTTITTAATTTITTARTMILKVDTAAATAAAVNTATKDVATAGEDAIRRARMLPRRRGFRGEG
jgi:hypothetical protein